MCEILLQIAAIVHHLGDSDNIFTFSETFPFKCQMKWYATEWGTG